MAQSKVVLSRSAVPQAPTLAAEARDSALLFVMLLVTTFGIAAGASALMHLAG